jgi:hypothetical protein
MNCPVRQNRSVGSLSSFAPRFFSGFAISQILFGQRIAQIESPTPPSKVIQKNHGKLRVGDRKGVIMMAFQGRVLQL